MSNGGEQSVSSFPERGGDLLEGLVASGELQGTSGGTSGLLSKARAKEKFRGSRRGTSGEVQGNSGKFREIPEDRGKSGSLPATR